MYLEEASTVINDYQNDDGTISFQTYGFEEGFFRFRNMVPDTTYTIIVSLNEKGGSVIHHSFFTDKNGILEIKIPFKGRAIYCH